jgi:hypothetical protein
MTSWYPMQARIQAVLALNQASQDKTKRSCATLLR